MDAREQDTAGTRRQAAGGPASNQPGPRSAPDTGTARPALSPLAEISDRVMVALTGIPVHGLTVSAMGTGTIHLDGAVRTETDRTRAEQLTREVPGVSEVVNQINVDPLVGSMPIEPTVLSPELAAEIELTHENFARGTEIDWNDDDVGTVDTAEATGEAIPYFAPTDPVIRGAPRNAEGFEVVGGFSGTAMESPINLEQLPREVLGGDDEVARLVRLALEEDAGTADLPVHVFVRDGIVHLRGTVPSLADADLAEEVASRVPGVAEVREELDVAGM